MEYREFLPTPPPLRAFIECYWSAVADQPPFQPQEALIPDGTIELMFNFGDTYQHLFHKNGVAEVKRGHVIGIRRKALYITQASRQDFFCVRFKPGGTFPFFGIPACQFADTILSLDDLLPDVYRDLECRLYATKAPMQRVALLNNFFLDQLRDLPAQWKTSSRFIATMEAKSMSVGQAMRTLQFNYKKLERHLKAATGLTPEEYLKIRRFNYAVKTMYAGQYRNMTEVGYHAGYYDQSHFIRDFKRLSGQTPLQFLKSKFKIVEVIQPALAERLSKSYNFND